MPDQNANPAHLPLSGANVPHGLEVLRTYGDGFAGREAELSALHRAWSEGAVRVFVLHAQGGAGKTRVVAKWLTELRDAGWRGAERVFVHSFYSQGSDERRNASSELFFEKALAYFGHPGPPLTDPTEKGRTLARLLVEHHGLLVLDGLEPLQHPPPFASVASTPVPCSENRVGRLGGFPQFWVPRSGMRNSPIALPPAGRGGAALQRTDTVQQSEDSMSDQVFISYSHRDKKFMEELQTHLKPYLRSGAISSWSDKQIAPGSKWFDEIQGGLKTASAAVLLVSPDFLSSDFIHEHELGPHLKEAQAGGVKILWIPLRASAYEETPLKHYQAVSSPDEPLAQMSKAHRDEAWVKICQEIKRAVNP